MTDVIIKPPSNTRWVHSRKDLNADTSMAKFRITKPTGRSSFEVIVKGRQKQTLQALMLGPVYCASVIRLGEYVSQLKSTHNVNIKTDWYKDDKDAQKTRYGTYTLIDRAEFLGEAS